MLVSFLKSSDSDKRESELAFGHIPFEQLVCFQSTLSAAVVDTKLMAAVSLKSKAVVGLKLTVVAHLTLMSLLKFSVHRHYTKFLELQQIY